MSTNNQYLDKLKNIRQKYGCSHAKIPSSNCLQQYTHLNKSPIKDTYKPDLSAIDKKKYYQPPNTSLPLPIKTTEFVPKSQNTFGISMQPYGERDYLRKIQKEKQINLGRESHQASRKKMGDDLSTRPLPSNYFKESTKYYNYDAARQNRDVGRDYYLRDRSFDQIGSNKPTRSGLLDQTLRAQDQISPIKRIPEYQGKRNYCGSPDLRCKARQIKLMELTPNRLNENKLFNQDEPIQDIKYVQNKRNDPYVGQNIKTFGYGNKNNDLQNKFTDFSVANIDRIQQRIQSILGRK